MSEIDPKEFGQLQAQVGALAEKLAEVAEDVKKLTAMAERSRGAFWLGLTLASVLGAGLSTLVGKAVVKVLG